MKHALGLAAVAAFAATGALAAHHKMMPDQEAMNARMEERFKEVDANADGKVSEKELVAFATKKAKTEFAAMAGGDKFVTLDEMKAHHQAVHEKMMKENGGMGAEESADEGADEGEHADHH